jgi:hypothetical protein
MCTSESLPCLQMNCTHTCLCQHDQKHTKHTRNDKCKIIHANTHIIPVIVIIHTFSVTTCFSAANLLR